jgi:hypothetical protein
LSRIIWLKPAKSQQLIPQLFAHKVQKNGGLLLDTLIQSFCSVKAKKPEGKHF